MIRRSTQKDFLGKVVPSSLSSSSSSRSLTHPLARPPFLSAASSTDLLGRLSFANKYGLLFAGNRNLHLLLGYLDNPTYDDYRSYYDRGDLARRAVNIFPSSIWLRGVTVQEDPDPLVTTEFEGQVKELFTRFDLLRQVIRVDKLAGIGHYAALLIGAEGDPSQELPRLNRLENILYISPYSEGQMKILEYEQDRTSPRFGLPLFYSLGSTRTDQIRGSLLPTTSIPKIHWTRVIHWANGCLDSEVFGTPRLKAVINKFVDLLKQVGGGSEAAYQRMDPPTLYDADPDYDIGEAEKKAFKTEIESLRQGLTRYALTSGITPHQQDNKVFNFEGNTSVIIEIIAGSLGIPVRIFRGSERGEQASSQDRNNFRDLIDAERTEDAEPNLRKLINRFGDVGLLSIPTNGYEIVWPKWSEKLTQQEKATIAANIASANTSQASSEGALIMTADEIRDQVFDLEPLTESNIATDPTSISTTPASLSTLANEPEWLSIHRVANSNIEPFSSSIIGVWKSVTKKLQAQISTLESALESGDLYKTLSVLDLVLVSAKQELTSIISSGLLKTSNEAGLAGLRSARARGGWFKKKRNVSSSTAIRSRSAIFEADFTTSNPRAISFAEVRSSILVTGIDQSTREGLQSLIAHGIRDGVPPRRLAREVTQSVGLRTDQIRAVSNLRSRLESAEPGSIVHAGSLRIRIPDSGITEDSISTYTDRYSDTLLNQRGLLIARTETLRSANEGQKELWRQAQESGSLPRDQKRVWLSTGDSDVRPEHLLLDGQVVGVNENFDPAIEPGEEPNCRCAQGLADESDIAAWEDRKSSQEEAA